MALPVSAFACRAEIIGAGKGLPAKKFGNQELIDHWKHETDARWVLRKTGIETRHFVTGEETAFSLALLASLEAIKNSGIPASDIEAIFVSTVSADTSIPNIFPRLQAGIPECKARFGLDTGAGCSGFVNTLQIASDSIRVGRFKKVLVVGVDVLSLRTDRSDLRTAFLFGDGAGAVVLSRVEDEKKGIQEFVTGTDGTGANFICTPSERPRDPFNVELTMAPLPVISMDGIKVFDQAIRKMTEVGETLLKNAGLKTPDIDLLVVHQANVRIINSTAHQLGIPSERVWVNIEKYGNTSSATIPLSFAEAIEQGRIKPGSKVLVLAVGAGMTWGGTWIQF